jgi:hypothetical protein
MSTDVYHAPEVPDDQITPEFVRNELLRCFESANREFYGILGQPVTDEEIRDQVYTFVTTVFDRCNVTIQNPTKEGIVTAIEQCKNAAEGMMGDRGADVIRHHYAEMMKLVSRLTD